MAPSALPCLNLNLIRCKEKQPSKVCGRDPIVPWWNLQTWPSSRIFVCTHFSAQVLLYPQRECTYKQIQFGQCPLKPKLRIGLGMSTFYYNPLVDWGNHLNFGFIFFLGFAITAAEEHGVGSVLHHARWKYFFAGLLFSCLRAVIPEIMSHFGTPDWISVFVDALLM